MTRLLVEIWTLTILSVNVQKKVRNMLLETRGELFTVVADSMAKLRHEDVWKTALCIDKPEYVTRQVSKQNIESPSGCLQLVVYCESRCVNRGKNH